jgi:hypothetical protein
VCGLFWKRESPPTITLKMRELMKLTTDETDFMNFIAKPIL